MKTTILIGAAALMLAACASTKPGHGGYCPFNDGWLENVTSPLDNDPQAKAPPDANGMHYTVEHFQCTSMWHHDFYWTNAIPIKKP